MALASHVSVISIKLKSHSSNETMIWFLGREKLMTISFKREGAGEKNELNNSEEFHHRRVWTIPGREQPRGSGLRTACLFYLLCFHFLILARVSCALVLEGSGMRRYESEFKPSFDRSLDFRLWISKLGSNSCLPSSWSSSTSCHRDCLPVTWQMVGWAEFIQLPQENRRIYHGVYNVCLSPRSAKVS